MPEVSLPPVVTKFFETTIGRAIRRALVLSAAAAATAFLGALLQEPSLQNAAPSDLLPFCLYWTARTLMDLLNPRISNL